MEFYNSNTTLFFNSLGIYLFLFCIYYAGFKIENAYRDSKESLGSIGFGNSVLAWILLIVMFFISVIFINDGWNDDWELMGALIFISILHIYILSKIEV
jgi:hypothetical protein